MTSGANFGFKRTIPHMLGVSFGFVFMVILVGIGVMQVFQLFPLTYEILKVLSIIYLLYLAYRIATSAKLENKEQKTAKPLTFLQAALFQWVNPKAWTMALMSITLYAPGQELYLVVIVAAVFGAINLPCVLTWIMLGKSMTRVLKNERSLHIFNIIMALMLIASIAVVV